MKEPLKKHGYELWIDVKPDTEIRLRHGASFSWAGSIENIKLLSSKATGSGLKNRSVGMPLTQTTVKAEVDTKILAKFGAKQEIYSLPISDGDIVYFRGKFYLGHTGNLSFDARKISLNNFMFFVQAKGDGTLFLGLPKGLSRLRLEDKTFCTNSDYIAVIIGEPSIRKTSSKEEYKILKQGGISALDTCELSGADYVYIYGGTMKKPFSFFSNDSDDES